MDLFGSSPLDSIPAPNKNAPSSNNPFLTLTNEPPVTVAGEDAFAELFSGSDSLI